MTLDTIAIEKEPLTTLVTKNVRTKVFPYFENSVPRDKPKRCGTIRLNFCHVNTLFRGKKQQQSDKQKCCGKVEINPRRPRGRQLGWGKCGTKFF